MNNLKITSYSAPNSGSQYGEFDLQVNPISIKINRTTGQGVGVLGAAGQQVASRSRVPQPASIEFSFTLDNTGVVPTPINGGTITESISQLENLCVENKSNSNQNPFIKLTWGNTFDVFNFGQVSKFGYDYNFFDSNGNPLRAVVSLTVTEIPNTSQSNIPGISGIAGDFNQSGLSSALTSTPPSSISSLRQSSTQLLGGSFGSMSSIL
tara:strand:+ start:275 stop:901 length:627 start_codon:yes stop_codon:yes gene_type:complete